MCSFVVLFSCVCDLVLFDSSPYSPPHLRSLLSAGRRFFVCSFVVVFIPCGRLWWCSCHVVSCVVLVCVTCFSLTAPPIRRTTFDRCQVRRGDSSCGRMWCCSCRVVCDLFVFGRCSFGVLFLSCVCVCWCRGCCSLSVCVCVCDLLIFLHPAGGGGGRGTARGRARDCVWMFLSCRVLCGSCVCVTFSL